MAFAFKDAVKIASKEPRSL